jgi:hypothetical protein
MTKFLFAIQIRKSELVDAGADEIVILKLISKGQVLK